MMIHIEIKMNNILFNSLLMENQIHVIYFEKNQRSANVYRIKGYLNQFANGHKSNFI